MEMPSDHKESTTLDLGFGWWKAWGWLGITIGNIYIIATIGSKGMTGWFLVIANSIFCIMILQMNKYAFLVATIMSLNPLIWIINGVYLKRRWRHPRLNPPKGPF